VIKPSYKDILLMNLSDLYKHYVFSPLLGVSSSVTHEVGESSESADEVAAFLVLVSRLLLDLFHLYNTRRV